MKKLFSPILVAITCMLTMPMVAFAQLPSPSKGWNLGNTLEPPCGEGCWGPPATQALINSVAAAGFNTVRIPCAWNSHANSQKVIDPAYMARVKQVVDWCLAKNMHVIINDHWDNGWFENNSFTRYDSKLNSRLQTLWQQIANTFKNYDSRLLFACANEPNADTQAKTTVLFRYYQNWVNTIRATGGNNTTRWIIVQGPYTNPSHTYNWVTMPTDPTPGRLMLEVHYYEPWQFTHLDSDQSWGNMFYFWGQGYHSTTLPSRNATWGEEAFLNGEMDKMKTKFVNAGYPVLFGEWSADKKPAGSPGLTGGLIDLNYASVTYWNKYVYDAINSRGMFSTHWDIHGRIFDWNTGAILNQTLLDSVLGKSALPRPPGTL